MSGEEIVCLECGEPVARSRNVLGHHVRKIHGLTFEDYVVKHEHSGARPTCGCGCGEAVKYHKGGFPKFAKGHSSRGENNPMHGKTGADSPIFGIKRTEEQLENYKRGARKRWSKHGDKLRGMMQTDEYKTAMSQSQLVVQQRSSVKKKKSEWSLKWWQNNPAARDEWRERAIRLLEEGKIGPQAPFKAEWVVNPFTGKQEYMHSSWELEFLIENVRLGNPVTKVHGIRINYEDHTGKQRTYIPDFLGLDDKTLYEVKGWEAEIDKAKWKAAKLWCMVNPEIARAFVVLHRL